MNHSSSVCHHPVEFVHHMSKSELDTDEPDLLHRSEQTVQSSEFICSVNPSPVLLRNTSVAWIFRPDCVQFVVLISSDIELLSLARAVDSPGQSIR